MGRGLLGVRVLLRIIHDGEARTLQRRVRPVHDERSGAIARRIVFHVKEGDQVVAGERFGIVKFGSRMDVIVPTHIHFKVQVGDRVVAGESVLATVTSVDIDPSTNRSTAARPVNLSNG